MLPYAASTEDDEELTSVVCCRCPQLAALLFASPAIRSPVVQLAFATTAANAHYLLAGYQSRAIEVWAPLVSAGVSSAKPRDPQRVAVTQL